MEEGRHFKITQTKNAEGKVLYFCLVDCWCGSSMSSGEWMTDVKLAVEAARESIEDHEAKGKHCKPREGVQS